MKVSAENSVIHLDFPDEVSLMSSLLRFQEHYESPNFKGEIFTLGQFRQWYTEEYEAFSYYTDWGGCNFPDYVLESFLEGLFDPLSPEEKLVVDVCRHIDKPFYVIGTSGERNFEHEMAHALFYLDKRYRASVENVVANAELSEIRTFLLDQGYDDDVFIDEANAYICTSMNYLEEHEVSVPKDVVKKLLRKWKNKRPT